MNTKQGMHNHLCDIYVAECNKDVVKENTIVRINDRNGYFTHPILSPNGEMVAFWGIYDKAWDVWIANLKTKRVKNLTEGKGTNCHPAWSPDSTKIVYSHAHKKALTCNPYASPWGFDNSDDTPRNVWTIDIESGRKRQLTHNQKDSERPAWSPDGRFVAYVLSEKGTKNIWIIDLNTGQNKPVTDNRIVCYRPAWHHSGAKLAFNNKGTGDHYIWTIDIDGENLQQVTWSDNRNETVYDHGSFWDKDGNNILFHSNRSGTWGLWLVNIRNGVLKTVDIPDFCSVSHATWDFNERLICFDAPR